MTRPYGKMPRHAARGGRGAAAPASDRLVIHIKGRHTLEQFSFELQKAVARLQEHGAHGVEACTLYLKPLDAKGQLIAIADENGAPLTSLPVNREASPPPFAPD